MALWTPWGAKAGNRGNETGGFEENRSGGKAGESNPLYKAAPQISLSGKLYLVCGSGDSAVLSGFPDKNCRFASAASQDTLLRRSLKSFRAVIERGARLDRKG